MLTMQIKNVTLDDKIIDQPEVVSFVSQCINEINGMQNVSLKLKNADLTESATHIYQVMRAIQSDGGDDLNIDNVNADTLKNICKIIIDTLIDYEDLENIMGLNATEAARLLDLISAKKDEK